MNRLICCIILSLSIIFSLGSNVFDSTSSEHPVQEQSDIDYIQYKEHSIISRGANHNNTVGITVTTLILNLICIIRIIGKTKLKLFLFCPIKSFKHLENLTPKQFQSKLFAISFTKI